MNWRALAIWGAVSAGLHAGVLLFCPAPQTAMPQGVVFSPSHAVQMVVLESSAGSEGQELPIKDRIPLASQSTSSAKPLPKVQEAVSAPEKQPVVKPQEQSKPLTEELPQASELPVLSKPSKCQNPCDVQESDLFVEISSTQSVDTTATDVPGPTAPAEEHNKAVEREKVESKDPPSGGPVRVEAAPAYQDNPPPVYPRLASRKGWQGEVLLRVHVSAAGRAQKIDLEKSSGFKVLDQSAQRAVRRWKFHPARIGESAVEGQVLVPVTFKLIDE